MSEEDSGAGVRHPSVRARPETEQLIATVVIASSYLVVLAVLIVGCANGTLQYP
jgi:hypothetical protein